MYFRWNSWKLLFWQIFIKNFWCVFFLPYLSKGQSNWYATKKKSICWILGIICDLNLSLHSWHWPWMFQGQISKNSCISEIAGLIDVKWKGHKSKGYWAHCMTLTFDHTHDLDLGVLRSESEIALSQEWDGQSTWIEKNVRHPFMTMILTSVTMMGWADVPDNDRGDFRRRSAVDISSLGSDMYRQVSNIRRT